MKITQQLPATTGVASGGTAVTVLPIGLSYETIAIDYAGSITPALLTNIQLVANGKPIQEYRSGAELDTYNQFNKRTAAATNTILFMDLTRRLLTTPAGREYTKLGTGMPVDNRVQLEGGRGNPNYNPFPVQTLTLQFDLGTFTAGTITCYGLQSAPSPTGYIRKIRRFTYGPTSTEFEISDLPKGDLINAIYVNYGVKVTFMTLKRDNFTVFERPRVLNNVIQTDGQIRTPQSGLIVLDTTEEGNAGEVIVTAGVNDLRLILDFSTTPTTCTLTVDYIGNLDR